LSASLDTPVARTKVFIAVYLSTLAKSSKKAC